MNRVAIYARVSAADKGQNPDKKINHQDLRQGFKDLCRRLGIKVEKLTIANTGYGLGRNRLKHNVKNVCGALQRHSTVGLAAESLNCSRGYIYSILKDNGLAIKDVKAGQFNKKHGELGK